MLMHNTPVTRLLQFVTFKYYRKFSLPFTQMFLTGVGDHFPSDAKLHSGLIHVVDMFGWKVIVDNLRTFVEFLLGLL